MEDLLMPFRRNSKVKEEAKEEIKDHVGTDLAMEHRAKARIREADLEFEKAFAEVMGIPFKPKKLPEEEEPPAAEEMPCPEKKQSDQKQSDLKAIVEMAKKEKEPIIQESQKEEEKKEIVQKVIAEMKANAVARDGSETKEELEEKEVDPELKKKQQAKWATFNFWYSDRNASSYAEFKDAIKAIGNQSLEHHARNNDFSKYLREFYDKKTADKIEYLENSFRGEELRSRILKTL
ncbi:MAG: hypothetical protein QXK06_01570 [Candidatus Diapherotrites archaeon]